MNMKLANARRLTATTAAVCAAVTMTATAVAAEPHGRGHAPLRPLPDGPPVIIGKGHAPLLRVIARRGDRALSEDPPVVTLRARP
jgi:hypothetical protein